MKNAPQYEQRWLSFDGICSALRLPELRVKALVRQGALVALWDKQKTWKGSRFLDPTPEYAEKLRLGAALYHRAEPVPHDFQEMALFTLREMAVILGLTLRAMRVYVHRHEVPHYRINSHLCLYTAATVRDVLWKRQKKTAAEGRSPFLLTELIDLFRRWNEENPVHSNEEFLADDLVQAKLAQLLKQSEKTRDAAFADFTAKLELARKVVQILESTSGSSPKDGLLPASAEPEPHR